MIEIIRNLTFLLDKKEKRYFYRLLFLMILAALVDLAFMLGLMFFLSILADENLITSLNIYPYIDDLFNLSSAGDAIMFICMIVSSLLILAFIVKCLVILLQSHFILKLDFVLGERLLKKYLNQQYSWILQRHSSTITKTIIDEVQVVVREGFLPASQMIYQMMVAFLISCLLIYLDPLVALYMGTMVLMVFAFLITVAHLKIRRLSKLRVLVNEERFKALTEIFAMFKPIKLASNEKHYFETYSKPAREYVRYAITAQVITMLPRSLVEFLTFFGILLFVFLSVSGGTSIEVLLPSVLMYMFAGARLIPALQQVYGCYSQIKYIGGPLANLKREMEINYLVASQSDINNIIRMMRCIELEHVSFEHDESAGLSIKNVSLKISRGETIGIVGPTGSGKSSLIDLIIMLLKPSEGSVKIDGKELAENEIKAWQSTIGYVSQTVHLNDKTIAENIAFGLSYQDINWKRVYEVAKIAQLDEFIKSNFQDGYATKIGEHGIRLSGGQRQRLGLARALYTDPDIIVLDEATSALDIDTEEKILRSLRQLKGKKTIIMVAHRYNTLVDADMIYVLENGEITQTGSFGNILGKDTS